MGNEGESVVRRFYERATTGDVACWELWDEHAVSRPPAEFPESDETKGVDEKRASVIYTVREGKVARAEHYMDRAVAREAAEG